MFQKLLKDEIYSWFVPISDVIDCISLNHDISYLIYVQFLDIIQILFTAGTFIWL